MSTQMPGVGAILGGDFRIERQLGAGGMGAVYVAEQLSTGRKRAIKLMHPSLVSDAKLRERFEQEARVGAKIPSDHVVQVIAAGVDEGCGAPYLAMELLEGEDLAATLARRGALSAEETRTILEPVCHALGAAHAASVVHRDLKPENVFLSRAQGAGRSYDVKLLDFGIAKLTAEARTMATSAVGTPLWMAPEQTDPRAKITPGADVWSLGLLVFALLVGKPYWRAASEPGVSVQALLREILFEPLVPASVRAVELGFDAPLPAELDRWFAKCVHREPAARFATAKEAWEALVPALGSELRQPAELAALAALGTGPAGAVFGLSETAPVGALPDAGMAATIAAPSTPLAAPTSAPAPASATITGVGVGRTAPEVPETRSKQGTRRMVLGIAAVTGMLALTWQLATKRADQRNNAAMVEWEATMMASGAPSAPSAPMAPLPPLPPPPLPPEAHPSPSPPDSSELPPPQPEPPKPPITQKNTPKGAAGTQPSAQALRPFDHVAAQRIIDSLVFSAKNVCRNMHGPRAFGLTVHFNTRGVADSYAADPSIRTTGSVNCAGTVFLGARIAPYDPPEGSVAVSVALE